jgi:hypothetical protein
MHGCVRADASACQRGRVFLPSARTVKTRPWIKMRPLGKRGRPEGKFYHSTSV